MAIKSKKEKIENGFHAVYSDFAKIFRLWLVAYGIGVPVILLPRENVILELKAVADGRRIIFSFFAGVFIQVALAWLYKLSMWWSYMWETNRLQEDSGKYKFIDWFTTAFWVEALADWFTIILYSYATLRILFIII